MTDKEVMQMALDALERLHRTGDTQVFDMYDAPEVIPALRIALAQPEKEWVGLTDDERHGIREWQEIQNKLGPAWSPMMLYFYLAIEAKLKEKNGY